MKSETNNLVETRMGLAGPARIQRAERATRLVRFSRSVAPCGRGRSLPATLATLAIFFIALALAPFPVRAQIDKMSGDQLMQLMQSQPRLAMDKPVAPEAAFDPPVVRLGGKIVYRVTLHTLDEAITKWPDKMPAPAGLTLTRGAQGMMFNYGPGTMQPLTQVNFHVVAAKPGEYVMPAFVVEIYGQPVTIPEAKLQVAAGDPGVPASSELALEPERTNVYVGESIRVRVVGPSSADRSIHTLSQVQLDGDGFIIGKGEVSQQIRSVTQPDGQSLPAFIYETSLTPFSEGPLPLSAQAFTSGNLFNGAVSIQGGVTIPGGLSRSVLVESPTVTLNVKPVPSEGRLPGFMGAIGKLSPGLPQLSAPVTQVGNPVKLKVAFHSATSLAHLAMPPAVETPAWQVYSSGLPSVAGRSATLEYTLVPQTTDTTLTPEIPFSCFDPDAGKYIDISIPAMPIHVLPAPGQTAGAREAAPLARSGEPEKKLSLSGLSPGMGRAAVSLVPLQQRAWFWAAEAGPLLILFLLWWESRRRLFWERHPDLRRRRAARRALRRERRAALAAAAARDPLRFAACGLQAIRVACAPHFPAEPRALVCGDVLQLLPEAERAGEHGEVVRRFFGATDALDFGGISNGAASLLEWQPQLERLLAALEVRL